jgi:hypothetical protein
LADDKKAEPKGQDGDRAEIVKFLKEHVMGKTLATPKTIFKVDGDKVEGEYEDRTIFNNLSETEHGFSFEVTTIMKDTRYDIDKDGKRIQPGRDLSGTEVFRYEFGERTSTKRVTGIGRMISRTTKGASFEGTAILVTGVKLANGKLSWNETQPGYVDLSASKGGYIPGSFDSKYLFSVVDGKLVTEYEAKRYDVDPETLKRTPTKDTLPPFISKEVDQK